MCCIVLKYSYLCVVNVRKGKKHQALTKKKKHLKLIEIKIMKKQASNLFTAMSNTVVENLTQVVKETLATGLAGNQRKTFTSFDLWNIHRQRKNLAYRR